MGFYDEMQEIATELLTEFNQGNISLVVSVPTGGTEWKPTGGVQFIFDAQGVVRGVSSKYIMRGLAIEGDKEITTAVIPNLSDNDAIKASFGLEDGEYKVVSYEKLPANGTPVALKFIVRKS